MPTCPVLLPWPEGLTQLPAALALAAATTLDELELYADKEGIMDFMRYFGKYPANTTLEEVQELFLPYRYGHATEVSLLVH